MIRAFVLIVVLVASPALVNAAGTATIDKACAGALEGHRGFDKAAASVVVCEDGKWRQMTEAELLAAREETARRMAQFRPLSKEEENAALFREARSLFIQQGMLFTVNRCLFMSSLNDNGSYTLNPIMDGEKQLCKK